VHTLCDHLSSNILKQLCIDTANAPRFRADTAQLHPQLVHGLLNCSRCLTPQPQCLLLMCGVSVLVEPVGSGAFTYRTSVEVLLTELFVLSAQLITRMASRTPIHLVGQVKLLLHALACLRQVLACQAASSVLLCCCARMLIHCARLIVQASRAHTAWYKWARLPQGAGPVQMEVGASSTRVCRSSSSHMLHSEVICKPASP
jgi:hypothetical protein